MAGVTGLEPAASGVTGRRSNQLSYTPNLSLHPRGSVDVTTPPGGCQDMNAEFVKSMNKFDTLHKEMVGDDGLEPPTFSV
jgi:hypothetical protein